MSAATETPTRARASHQPLPPSRLRFSGVLKSEWIKLTTLRSTVWAYLIVVLLQIGMAALFALTVNMGTTGPGGPGAPGGGAEAAVTGAAATQTAVLTASLGVMLGQLVVSVLGVLVISGEYGTGQIRSTFTAVPKRLPVLWGKALVFAVSTFVVGLIAVFAAYAVTWGMLDARGVTSDITDPDVWGRLVGAAGYLVLVGLIAYFLGAILRVTAGGIAAAVGLVLVVPIVLGFVNAEWASVLGQWLPSSAGQTLFLGGGVFEPWQAVLVMLGWIAVFATTAAVLLKRRDA